MKKNLYVNGVDVTDICGPAGYEVTYEKILGSNGGIMLSGLEIEDVLGFRAVVRHPLLPITEAAAETFLTNVYSSQYAELTYFDLMSGDYKTASCIYEVINSRHLLTSVDGNDYWYCGELVFRDREGVQI